MTSPIEPQDSFHTPTLPTVIGMHGFPGSGKDTAAVALIKDYGYERVGLADPMRTAMLALNPWVRAGDWSDYDDNEHDPKYLEYPYNTPPVKLKTLIDKLGWEGAKRENLWRFEVRGLLQRFGTDVGRDILGENIWIETSERNATSKNIVVTDIRFPNEAAWIRARGGLLINIVRPGYNAVNNHASESVLKCDVILHNDNDVDTLLALTKTLVLNHGKETS